MEPKHKELLAQCRQSLAQAMTEVDKVVELLEAAGALGPRDLRDLEAAGGGKAELLIALLLAKERDHFQDLRVALEKTQPHLLSILYLNGAPGTAAAAEETAGERGGGRGHGPGPGGGGGGGRRASGCPRPAPPGRVGPSGLEVGTSPGVLLCRVLRLRTPVWGAVLRGVPRLLRAVLLGGELGGGELGVTARPGERSSAGTFLGSWALAQGSSLPSFLHTTVCFSWDGIKLQKKNKTTTKKRG